MNIKSTADTLLAQAGHYIDEKTGAVVPPIYATTTFARNSDYELQAGYQYGRDQNPTYLQVEKLAAQLDGGAEAKLFASGMAAITAVFGTIKPGQHIVAPRIMYHGARDWLRYLSQKYGIGVTWFDARDPSGLAHALTEGPTALVWIETPANPTWDVIDIAETAKLAHQAGAALAVDCTVAPPVTTRALDLGADLVFHSATKYFNGHSDLTAGILVTAKDDDRWHEIKYIRKMAGGIAGSFEAWLLLRGMRTLSLRFERASQNALALARHFEHHPSLAKVLYPGLESHPGHQIAQQQMKRGFGGMLSLLVKGGEDAARSIASKTRCFVPATSLGGVESLIEHRAAVEGPFSETPRNLLRLSVGIENVEDLMDDLKQALET